MDNQGKEQWKYCIEPGNGKAELGLKSLWQYRGLVYLFARRDFTSRYRQTLLGPLWMFLNPLLTTVVFTVVFGNMAKFPTMDNTATADTVVPAFLFYMIGNILWGYFSNTVKDVSKTLIANVRIMGKVYYPRLASPVASALSNQMTMAVRLLLFVCFYVGGVACGYNRPRSHSCRKATSRPPSGHSSRYRPTASTPLRRCFRRYPTPECRR